MSAHRTLPSLSRPLLPPLFAGASDREIVRLSRLLATGQLSLCAYQSPETRWPCSQMATVYHLATDQELCARHFQAVNRG